MTFKDDLETDLDVFLNASEFATDITYKSATITGIFDNAYVVSALDTDDVETLQPQVYVKSGDVVGIVQGDTMTINGITYKVISPQPDGTGLTLVILSRD
jgi:hypothetical protein